MDVKVIDALVASARIVWENGGWSGASGNWPLVEAFGQLEAIEELDPELFARISERLPVKEYNDEPCSLCNGTGKSPNKTVGQIEHEAFEQGKKHAELVHSLHEKGRP